MFFSFVYFFFREARVSTERQPARKRGGLKNGTPGECLTLVWNY